MIRSRLRRFIYWLLELVPCEVCGALVGPAGVFAPAGVMVKAVPARSSGKACWPCALEIRRLTLFDARQLVAEKALALSGCIAPTLSPADLN